MPNNYRKNLNIIQHLYSAIKPEDTEALDNNTCTQNLLQSTVLDVGSILGFPANLYSRPFTATSSVLYKA